MVFYDFEVLKYDWLVVIIDPRLDEPYKIHNNAGALERVYRLYRREIWTGYNSTHYDQYILKGILRGFNPKDINDYIIKAHNPGWKFDPSLRTVQLYSYDCMTRGERGLKFLEGSMGNMIKESDVDFDIDRPLTDAEVEEMFFYCQHDVEQTMQVFRQKKSDFDTIVYFMKHYKLPMNFISKTKAQLAAHILKGNRKGTNADEMQFKRLDCVQLNRYKYIQDWYYDHDYNDTPQSVTVWGVPHVFSWGGGHGAIEKLCCEGTFVLADVGAYYPSMQTRYKLGYEVMNAPEEFEFIHNSNMEFKRKGDKKARQPFKIMDNAITGQLKQPSSAIYCPRANNEICNNGMMMLLDLIEHLEDATRRGELSARLIQNNTDGILLQLYDYDRDFDVMDDIVYEWEQRTGMMMEFDTFRGKLFQKDVNNYLIMDTETGAVKAKGKWLKPKTPLDNDLPIVREALYNYMTAGAPIRDTIYKSTRLIDFQMVCKISSKYEHLMYGAKKVKERRLNPTTGKMKTFEDFVPGQVLREKTVRVFASTESVGGLWVHAEKKSAGKYDRFTDTPDNCFMDNDDVHGKGIPPYLDREWYVRKAEERLKSFGI